MNKIFHGDSIEILKEIESESVDLLCTDPPYGYGFMGKHWDKALPDIQIFKECLRVLKPGAFAFVMSAPRSDVCARMMLMLEDAGFEIGFTPIYWTYASGFPKAMNIGKMVDKREGFERETIPTEPMQLKGDVGEISKNRRCSVCKKALNSGNPCQCDRSTKPITYIAKKLDGSYGGFQPKPAVEVIIVAMKPLSEKTYVDQALKNGKGITWLDDCRVPTSETLSQGASNLGYHGVDEPVRTQQHDAGRFPANLLVSDDVLGDHSRFFALPFLIVPKASKGEKDRGLTEDLFEEKQIMGGGGTNNAEAGRKFGAIKSAKRNSHPTVKPLKLMSYLITLGSRPGDVVLDPFVGSGTTCIAAKQLGRKFIGIEREEEYVEIANARLEVLAPTLL